MKKKILGENIEPKCEYCQFGNISPESDTVLCLKKGVLNRDDSCKKFRYDPLKRIPRQAPEPLPYSAGDFSLTDEQEDYAPAAGEYDLPPEWEEDDRPPVRGEDDRPADEEDEYYISDENFILE